MITDIVSCQFFSYLFLQRVEEKESIFLAS